MRYSRQNAIKDIVRQNEIFTQSELVKALQEKGFKVTQATVSRDISELGLIKRPSKSGKSCYFLKEDLATPQVTKLNTILTQTILSVESAENLIVIKTLSGCAGAAAEALDTADDKRIIGTIAGDNTILLIVKTKEDTPDILRLLKGAMEK